MEIYVASIISTILGYLASIYANKNHKGFLPHFGIVVILSCLAGVLTFTGLRIFTPQTDRLEGQWIERYQEGENVIYAVAKIEYDPEAKHLKFSGNSYDPKGNWVGYWETIQARHTGDQYDYLYNGESMNTEETRQGLRKGVGGIRFDNDNHGTGYFFSVREDIKLRQFELQKILNEDATRQSKSDPKGFIQKLNNDPSYLKQVTSVRE
jgi:hypothetical protein